MHKDRQAAGVKLCDAEVEGERRRAADPSFRTIKSATSMNKGLNKREVLVCSDDPLNDGVSDLVVDHPVVGTADEELVLIERRGKKDTNQERDFLFRECFNQYSYFCVRILASLLVYLYVDVVFALHDDLDVGVMDGLLVVLYACRPICRGPQHLVHADIRSIKEVILKMAASQT